MGLTGSPTRSTGSGWNGSTAGAVSVLIATIPERVEMLKQVVASVTAQTFSRWELLILTDPEYQGQSKSINTLADAAVSEWVFPFDDDDLLHPSCLERLLLSSEAGVIVYAPPNVEGEAPEQFCRVPPEIPTPALIPKKLWLKLGGYNEDLKEQEDRDFFTRAQTEGVQFKRVDEYLWTYRFHGKNKSRGHTPGDC